MKKRKPADEKTQQRGRMLLKQIDQHFNGEMWIYTDRPIVNEDALDWLVEQRFVLTRDANEQGRARRYYTISDSGRRSY